MSGGGGFPGGGAGGIAGSGGVAGGATGGTGGVAGAATGGTGGSATGGTGGAPADVLIDVSNTHACAARNGMIKCWGQNKYGQLAGSPSTNAMGDAPGEMGAALPATDLGGAAVAGIAAGYNHTCVLTNQAGVRCWGSSDYGQCGFGTRLVDVDLGQGALVKTLDAGGSYNCAFLVSGAAKCWGANALYQLGNANTNNLGDDSGEMGDALPALSFGANTAVVDIVTGYEFACARLTVNSSPELRCWGSNDQGQLGFAPVAPSVPLASSTSILVSKPVLAVGAGRWHACAIHADGTVSCWGVNYYGELGLGLSVSNHPTPGPVDLGDYTAKAIALGTDHTCAIVEKTGQVPSIKCWGHNNNGQLGTDTVQSVGQTPAGLGNALKSVILPSGFVPKRIAASENTTCAASEAGEVLCWGLNDFGLLGQGRTDPSIGDAAGSMETLAPIDLGWP